MRMSATAATKVITVSLLASAILVATAPVAFADSARFNAFDELARTENNPQEPFYRYPFEDCMLFGLKVTGKATPNMRFAYLGPKGLGGLRLVRFDTVNAQDIRDDLLFFPKTSVEYFVADLSQLERLEPATAGLAGDTRLVMKRGAAVDYARVEVRFSFSEVSFGQSNGYDDAKVSVLIHLTQGRDFRESLGIIPPNWRDVATSEQLAKEAVSSGEYFPEGPNAVSATAEQVRSLSWECAEPWPEDRAKINAALEELVAVCT